MSFVNNWISWSYDQDPAQKCKLQPSNKMTISVNPAGTHALGSYQQEILHNMSLIRDSISGPLDLAFSGGGDSELALRCFLELGIPVNVISFRYNDNLNCLELQRAQDICQDLGINQTVIDLDLQKFFENDAHAVWTTGYYLNAGRLVHMKMLEYLDNTPVFCDGVIQSAIAISQYHGEWCIRFKEISLSLANYANQVGRTVVSNAFDFSPRPLARFLKIPLVAGLFTNRLPDIKDYSVIKYQLMNQLYPAIAIRPKMTGFEGVLPTGKDTSRPPYMIDFNKQYIFEDLESQKFKIAASEVVYTYSQMINLFSKDHVNLG
jgi:hypothetical protein